MMKMGNNTGLTRNEINWELFEDYNRTDARLKADKLKGLGIEVSDAAVIGVLTKSNFVIPGKTRFGCVQCGECCRYAQKIAELRYEPCLYLTKDNKCKKHDSNYNVCKWFPFWTFTDKKYGDLLTIKPYCSGYGKGEVVDYDATIKRMHNLAKDHKSADDGAFVIHEVLYLPERKAWFFPSRQNIDELLLFITKQNEYRKRDEESSWEELYYAQQKTSGLLGNVNEPQLTVSERGLITDVNGAFAALCKRNKAELVGKSFGALFTNADYVERKLQLCLSKGTLTALPLRMSGNGGDSINIILHALSYRDKADGLVHGVLVSVQPITSDLYREAVSSQEYARNIIEASIDSMMAIDSEGVITDVNEACCELFGYSRAEIQNSKFSKYFDDADLALHGVELTYEQEKLKNYELNLINREGCSIPVSFNASVFKSIEGVPLGIIAIARDIREIKKLIAEIEAAKEYARGLIESSIDMMLTIDARGVIMDINEAVVRNTGFARTEIIGSRFSKYFIDKDLAAKGVELTFAQAQVNNYVLQLLTKDGKELWVSFNASLYKNKQEVVQGIFAIARVMEGK